MGLHKGRWLQLSNEPLASLLDETIGTSWRKEPTDLQMLMNYYDDDRLLELLADTNIKIKFVLLNTSKKLAILKLIQMLFLMYKLNVYMLINVNY